MTRSAFLLALALAVAPAWASQVDVAADGTTLQQQRAAIEAEIAGGETYAEMTPEDLRQTRSLLDRMEAMLGGGRVDALTERQKADLFNLQEQVNQILLAAEEDSRSICRRERPTGSHRATTICKTVAERRRNREDAQDYLRNRSATKLIGN